MPALPSEQVEYLKYSPDDHGRHCSDCSVTVPSMQTVSRAVKKWVIALGIEDIAKSCSSSEIWY
jgi:hypothetical protein